MFLSFYKGVGRCPAQTKNCFFLFLWNKANYSHLDKYKSEKPQKYWPALTLRVDGRCLPAKRLQTFSGTDSPNAQCYIFPFNAHCPCCISWPTEQISERHFCEVSIFFLNREHNKNLLTMAGHQNKSRL